MEDCHCEAFKTSNKPTFIPSSTIADVSDEEDDSMEMTPSMPIFSIVSAIKFPTNSSLPAEIEATATEHRNPISLISNLRQEVDQNLAMLISSN